MMKVFKIAQMFNENMCLGGKSSGQFLRNEIEIALNDHDVHVDFEGLPLITQSFSDEFLGPLVADRGEAVLDKITFKNCSDDIEALLTWTVNRFLANKQGIPS